MTNLTLIVTAHRTNYLAEAMLSVAAQSSNEFDLICCADTSHSDAAYRAFEHFASAARCQSVRVAKVAGNGTAGRVRNFGFSLCRTEWTCYLDGDDLLHPDAMAVLNRHVRGADNGTRLFSTGLIRIDSEGVAHPEPESLEYYPPHWIYELDPESFGLAHYFNQLQAVRRSAWEEYQYDESTNGEDFDFVLHQLLLGKYQKIPEYMYFLRDTPSSFSSKHFAQGDIATQRYTTGYYRSMVRRNETFRFPGNFRCVPSP